MFPPMLVGAVVGGTASCLSLLHHYRQQLGPMSMREALWLARLPVTPIAEAPGQGLVKLVGTVGGLVTQTSYYHRVPCVALELHHYEVVDGVNGPRRVLVRKERFHHGFWIEDETGRIGVDPAQVRIDFEVEGGDLESTVEEHRIRVGERVAVLAEVRRRGMRLTQPMRQAATVAEGELELSGRPLLTWRSEPEVFPRLGPPAGGVALSAGSIGLAVLGSVLNL
jgi:hypothetical protein